MALNQSGKVALGGIITAVCTVLMFLTGLIPIGTYALPAIAGVLLMVIVIELGSKWAWMVFLAVSLLSALLAADKEAVLLFIIFFGYYPILKYHIEHIHSRITQMIIKLAVFNVSMIAAFFIAIKLLSVPEDSFVLFGVSLPWIFLLVGNLVFFMYDYSLTGLVSMYISRLHNTLKKILHLR
ncbi:MAG: hypothetical protein HFE39_06000 [Clostridiales bacterium]|nr:hypothetical protein [Clostridiales bacterium]